MIGSGSPVPRLFLTCSSLLCLCHVTAGRLGQALYAAGFSKISKRIFLHKALPCTGLPLIGLYFLTYPRPCSIMSIIAALKKEYKPALALFDCPNYEKLRFGIHCVSLFALCSFPIALFMPLLFLAGFLQIFFGKTLCNCRLPSFALICPHGVLTLSCVCYDVLVVHS